VASTTQSKTSTFLAPGAVIMAVLLMVVPLPPLMLDLLLSADIGLAVVLMLTAIYVREPAEFSVFPSLLLLLTLLRLSLNVASTRLVLLNGANGVDAAGHVIEAFGQFVVGGNLVVGVVVFLVLVAIQYVVINHGAVRISEVTARFTLDALPGRQMAIDADLNAGVIDDREARIRRDKVRREADFYGAMDGASRFTQRDALAAVIITGVNIVAGLGIGVLQHGLDLATAFETYTILTVGEGLVTAIPSLLVSIAGGLITTRAASGSNLGEDVAGQLLARSQPLAVAGAVLFGLALIPGLPKLPFVVVGGLLVAAAWGNRVPKADAAEAAAATPAPSEEVDPLVTDALSLEVGYGLISLVDDTHGGTFLTRMRAIRRQVALDTGVVAPPVRVADNLLLGPRTYTILLRGVEVARGELYPDRLLAINPGKVTVPLDGVNAKDPAFGLPAVWVAQSLRETATTAGYTVVDATTAMSTHLSETVRTFLPELLDRQLTKELIDRVGKTSPKLVEDLVPKQLSVGEIQRVLRQLLRERVPIKDLTTILEALGDAVLSSKDLEVLTEACRTALGRAICRQYQTDRGELPAISVSPSLEQRLLGSIVRTDQGPVLACDPADVQSLATRIVQALETAVAQPVLLCSPALRPHLWRLVAKALPHVGVLSRNEVPTHVSITPVAVLD
jgi:flagellar biosynthesis protein FlhA